MFHWVITDVIYNDVKIRGVLLSYCLYNTLLIYSKVYHLHVTIVLKSGSLNLLEPSGLVQACNGIALPFILMVVTGTKLLKPARNFTYRQV